jgi:hypothetical protein
MQNLVTDDVPILVKKKMFSVTLPQDDVSCSATFQLSFHLI